jgi:hypothetical protein
VLYEFTIFFIFSEYILYNDNMSTPKTMTTTLNMLMKQLKGEDCTLMKKVTDIEAHLFTQ